MTESRKLRVFLCHASQDKPIVRELHQRLVSENWIDPWLDEEKLLPGQDWDIEIEKAVETADAVIVCLSNNSVTKEGYLQKELRKILNIAAEKAEGTIFIIPLRLDDCTPPRSLAKWQYVDYFQKENSHKSFMYLLQGLISRAKSLGIEIGSAVEKGGLQNIDITTSNVAVSSFNLAESLAVMESIGFTLAIFSALLVNFWAPLSWSFYPLLRSAFIANIALVVCIQLFQYLILPSRVQNFLMRVKVTNIWLISFIWILPLPVYYLLVFKLLRGG